MIYPIEFKNNARVQGYLRDGINQSHALAIYHTVESMLKDVDRAIDANIATWGDEQLRYYTVKAKTLRDILKLPDMAKEKLQGDE